MLNTRQALRFISVVVIIFDKRCINRFKKHNYFCCILDVLLYFQDLLMRKQIEPLRNHAGSMLYVNGHSPGYETCRYYQTFFNFLIN